MYYVSYLVMVLVIHTYKKAVRYVDVNGMAYQRCLALLAV